MSCTRRVGLYPLPPGRDYDVIQNRDRRPPTTFASHQRINRFAPDHHHVFYSQRQVFLRHTVAAVRRRGTYGRMLHPRRQAEVRPRQGTEGRYVSLSMFKEDSLTCSPLRNKDYFKNDWTEGSKTPSGAPAKGTENVSTESQGSWSSLLTPSLFLRPAGTEREDQD